MLHLRDLHCFVLVYELHSFSRTADSLDTVQSMISTRIQRLEQFIGAPLFLRLRRGVLPTRKGDQLYQHAKRVVRDVAELESAVKIREAVPPPAPVARRPVTQITTADLLDY
jgi:LysR family transcriptional regulator, nitrogen assimilation regulatory protein